MPRSSSSDPIQTSSARRPAAGRIAHAVAIVFAGFSLPHAACAAGVLPQGGHYVAGAGTIAAQGNALTITQPGSTRGVIDWTGFSIGSGNTVRFDNGFGATLNRVTGGASSALLGSLSATGSVYLINPQGIVIGRSGVVSTGGRFVASTLDLPDTAFMNGGTLTLAGTSARNVVNLGSISSSGADVFLIAGDAVVNAGSVNAPKGTAEYVAARQVVLYESSASRQVFVQLASKGTVVDRGITRAAQINLEAADGNIYALAGGGSRIRATGTATRDGHIWLVAGNGHVTQEGTLTATNGDKTGGSVDTIANTLTLNRDAKVQAGLWNLSTPNFTVDGAAAGAFARSLNAGTSIDATATGTNGARGELSVASNVAWTGPASLALVAFRDVTIAPATSVRNTGSGNLSLRADAAGIDNRSSVTSHGTIDWSHSTGTVSAFYDMNGSYGPGTILANSAWSPAPFSGLVTQVTGYKLVNSLSDLRHVALDLAGNYALGKNIDASSTSDASLLPIGNTVTPFTGQFDGLGHSVSSLALRAWSGPDPHSMLPYEMPLMGMFGVIGDAGVVRNLNVNGTIANALTYGDFQVGYLGILAAANTGTVIRVNASGSLTDNNDFNASSEPSSTIDGGLVGFNRGTISRSSSSVAVTAGGMAVGGLVGINNGRVVQSFSTGPINVGSYTPEGAGGLVGNNGGTIDQSYSTSPNTFEGYCRGSVDQACGGAGLVAFNMGSIRQSFATGPVTQASYGPIGIAQFNSGTIANDVYWDKDTTTATIGVLNGTPVSPLNGLTTAQMSMTASFPTYDFGPNGVWALPTGATHPVLQWQLAH